MAMYAYRDAGRKNIIYASKAVQEDRNKTFFCPNSNCNARLHICSVDGSVRAHFKAKEVSHINGCPFSSKSFGFDPGKFDENSFSFDDAMDNIFSSSNNKQNKLLGVHNNGNGQKHPIRTLKQIYSMCKSYEINSTYAGLEISDMILDDRTVHKYQNGCFGKKIIEACVKGRIYNNNVKEVYLTSPIETKTYSFILRFENDEIYRSIRNQVYNNQNMCFVVAGDWDKTDINNCFISNISSLKQFLVIK